MKYLFIISLLFFSSDSIFSQTKMEDDIEAAYQNAKKGIYWALSNIPEKKSTLDGELIDSDKLIADIKLTKEINGIKIISTGFFLTNEVKITIYKSEESLLKEGFIKKEKEEGKQD